MTAIPRGTPGAAMPAIPGRNGDEPGGESYVRRAGRGYILALYGAIRAIKLYPVENAVVQRALDELVTLTGDMLQSESEIELRVSGEFLFINATRLRLGLENYASFSHLLSLLRAAGIGQLTVRAAGARRDWLVFLSLLQAPSQDAPHERFHHLLGRLEATGVTLFELAETADAEEEQSREHSKEVAKRTYAQSIAVTKDLMASVRMGRSPNIKKVKRVVQGIVDQIFQDEVSLVGLTAIRDYDEYTFQHSVNVCIFSVALGRRLGLSKLQLYDLGMSALFHDIGKSRVPSEVLNKAGGLDEEEWRLISSHPWLGVLVLFHLRGQQELPYRSMVVAHEHHMKIDHTGYPRTIRPRGMSMFSKIVAVADGFDAATSRRVYQSVPLNPAQVLAEMRDNPKRGMDQVVVKAFINLTGMYPVGTLVVLDTFELGVVHAVNPIPEMLSRPIVRVVSDDRGNMLHPGTLVDLADKGPSGEYLRTIIKTDDPQRYGIRVGDYFL